MQVVHQHTQGLIPHRWRLLSSPPGLQPTPAAQSSLQGLPHTIVSNSRLWWFFSSSLSLFPVPVTKARQQQHQLLSHLFSCRPPPASRRARLRHLLAQSNSPHSLNPKTQTSRAAPASPPLFPQQSHTSQKASSFGGAFSTPLQQKGTTTPPLTPAKQQTWHSPKEPGEPSQQPPCGVEGN